MNKIVLIIKDDIHVRKQIINEVFVVYIGYNFVKMLFFCVDLGKGGGLSVKFTIIVVFMPKCILSIVSLRNLILIANWVN